MSNLIKCNKKLLKTNPTSIIKEVLTEEGFYSNDWVKNWNHNLTTTDPNYANYDNWIKHCIGSYWEEMNEVSFISDPRRDPFGGHWIIFKVNVDGDQCSIAINEFEVEG